MDSFQGDIFPPAPMVTSNKPPLIAPPSTQSNTDYLMPANSVLGGSFGSSF
jgi:hypothetical protein